MSLVSSFVFGNGESRRELDINKFKQYGPTVGCNAIYRDYSPDILIAVDVEMTNEIILSGYANRHLVYFRGWDLIPSDMKESFAQMQIADHVIDNVDNHPNFVAIGHNADPVEGLESKLYLIGVSDECKARDLRNIQVDFVGMPKFPPRQYEFAGSVAAAVAARFADDVYLFGYDFGAIEPDGKINNMYKGCPNYLTTNSFENPNVCFWRVGDYFPRDGARLKEFNNFLFLTMDDCCDMIGLHTTDFTK